jgi:hypothetical protein
MKKYTLDTFVELANKIHNYKYNYETTIYKNMNIKIQITCPKHGFFFQSPLKHIYAKQGCPKCKFEKLHNLYLQPFVKFIKRANEIHSNKYNYIENSYFNSTTKICIVCKIHGEFWQLPSNHIFNKRGCPKCNGGIRLTTEEFIKKAVKIHGDIYSYKLVKYINNHNKISIICKEHGIFLQTSNIHLNGSGCPSCAMYHKSVSKASQKWLDLMKVSKENREIPLIINGIKYIVDGFDLKTNTIYEYFGSFWHGNPDKYSCNKINKISGKTFGIHYLSTVRKISNILNNGFNLIYIWGP